MGEIAEQVGAFVTAYSGDLKDRVARRAADRRRRHRDRIPASDHPRQPDDGRCDARGPPGIARGRRLPEALRADRRDMDRGRRPARRRSGRPPRRGGLAAGRPGDGLGRGRGAGTERRSRARSRPTISRGPRRQPVAVGPGSPARANDNGSNGRGPGPRMLRRSLGRFRTCPRSGPSTAGGAALTASSTPAPGPAAAAGRHDRVPDRGPTRSRPMSSRRPSSAWPPMTTSSPRCRTRPGTVSRSPPGRRRLRSTHRLGRSSTSRSPARPAPTASSGRWKRSRASSRSDPARPASSSTSGALGRDIAADGAAARCRLRLELLAEVRRRLGEGIVELNLS